MEGLRLLLLWYLEAAKLEERLANEEDWLDVLVVFWCWFWFVAEEEEPMMLFLKGEWGVTM